jgi:hypothetical protein
MFRRPETINRIPEIPPATRAVFPALVLTLLLALVAAWPLSATAAPATHVHTYELLPGLAGNVLADGALEFVWSGEGLPVLRAEPVSRLDARRRRTASFHAVVSEGALNGHRGFSARADDDGDGATDEDRLDGQDNDGDGLIDEDFAAISDGMTAIHLRSRDQGVRETQLEYYNWAYPHLRAAVFVKLGGKAGTGAAGAYRLATTGSSWREVAVGDRRHSAQGRQMTGRSRAFVSRTTGADQGFGATPCGPGSGLWVGMMVLDPSATDRISLAAGQLDISLAGKGVPLVVVAAESWLQLNRLLGETAAVYRGMTDPVNRRQAGWVVPPPCPICRELGAPEFQWRTVDQEEVEISAVVTADRSGLLDPDMFRLDGRPLGSPRALVWTPLAGDPVRMPWSCLGPDALAADSRAETKALDTLYSWLGHGAVGRLAFVFPAATGAATTGGAVYHELEARYLDGRSVTATLESGEPPREAALPAEAPTAEGLEIIAQGFAADRALALRSTRHPPTLAPELLQGWPNPFNDIIRIRFEVPATMKQAFTWKDAADRPANLDLAAPVPWSSGQPQVSVKIYTINGQELVTLHSGSDGVGEYSVQWNGTDAYGRQVASGTYFCKLQLDDWSVTRRLVYLR